jgi:hypothetical protein
MAAITFGSTDRAGGKSTMFTFRNQMAKKAKNDVKIPRIAKEANKYAEISDFGPDLPKLSSRIG